MSRDKSMSKSGWKQRDRQWRLAQNAAARRNRTRKFIAVTRQLLGHG